MPYVISRIVEPRPFTKTKTECSLCRGTGRVHSAFKGFQKCKKCKNGIVVKKDVPLKKPIKYPDCSKINNVEKDFIPLVSLRLLACYIGIMYLIWFTFGESFSSNPLVVILTGIYLVIAPIVYFLEKGLDKVL